MVVRRLLRGLTWEIIPPPHGATGSRGSQPWGPERVRRVPTVADPFSPSLPTLPPDTEGRAQATSCGVRQLDGKVEVGM